MNMRMQTAVPQIIHRALTGRALVLGRAMDANEGTLELTSRHTPAMQMRPGVGWRNNSYDVAPLGELLAMPGVAEELWGRDALCAARNVPVRMSLLWGMDRAKLEQASLAPRANTDLPVQRPCENIAASLLYFCAIGRGSILRADAGGVYNQHNAAQVAQALDNGEPLRTAITRRRNAFVVPQGASYAVDGRYGIVRLMRPCVTVDVNRHRACPTAPFGRRRPVGYHVAFEGIPGTRAAWYRPLEKKDPLQIETARHSSSIFFTNRDALVKCVAGYPNTLPEKSMANTFHHVPAFHAAVLLPDSTFQVRTMGETAGSAMILSFVSAAARMPVF